MSKLVRRDRVFDMPDVVNDFNRTFADFFNINKNTLYGKGNFSPPCDVHEEGNNIVLSMEISGIDPKDVSINVENGTLIIKGEKKSSRNYEDVNFYRQERSFGQFVRSFTLSNYVDTDNLKADYKQGVLIITLPKRKEALTKSVKINISE